MITSTTTSVLCLTVPAVYVRASTTSVAWLCVCWCWARASTTSVLCLTRPAVYLRASTTPVLCLTVPAVYVRASTTSLSWLCVSPGARRGRTTSSWLTARSWHRKSRLFCQTSGKSLKGSNLRMHFETVHTSAILSIFWWPVPGVTRRLKEVAAWQNTGCEDTSQD